MLFLALLLATFVATAQETAHSRKENFNLNSDGVALSGYDPVSYFTNEGPTRGHDKWAYTHLGVTYWFSSQSHLDLFKAQPSKYEPAYGGWCAYAVGNSGEKVAVDPLTYKIYNGKLLVFYNRFFTNTLTLWNKDETNLYKKAEKNWPAITNR